MNQGELINSYLYNMFKDINDLNDIFSYIENLKDTCIIEVRGIKLREALRKYKDPNYPLDLTIHKTENGISIPYMFDGLFDMIKNHINPSIKTLGLPSDLIKDFDFSSFKNLNNLINTGSSIDLEDLKHILNTSNISDIQGSFSFYKISDYDLSNYSLSDDLFICDKLTVHNDDYEYTPRKIVNIKIDNFDLDKLDYFLSKYDLTYMDVKITSSNGEAALKHKKDGSISLSANFNNMKDVEIFYNYMKEKSKIDEFIIVMDNEVKTSYTSFDYTSLDQIASKTNISISYDGDLNNTRSYIEFRSMVECIKYYRDLINAYPLSPLEKLMYAYDIMKTFPYKESENSALDSRTPARIISTGNIVCVGYTTFLSEILYDLDENIQVSNFHVDCFENDDVTFKGGHSRSIVSIDDPKYGISGYYALDPTWDSFMEEGKDHYGEDYDAFSLYRYFLIPFPEYKEVFKHDSLPDFFDGDLSDLNSNLSEENIKEQLKEIRHIQSEQPVTNSKFKGVISQNGLFKDSLRKNIIGGRSIGEILRRFDGRRIGFDEFMTAVRNVRFAQGYTGEFLETEVSKISRINSRYYGIDFKENDLGEEEYERKI